MLEDLNAAYHNRSPLIDQITKAGAIIHNVEAPLESRVPQEAFDSIREAVRVACERLGTRLRSIYGVGSLGYGNFAPGWSDIDIDLVVHDSGPELSTAEDLLNIGYNIRDAIYGAGFASVDIKCYSLAVLNDPNTVYEYGIANRAVMLIDSARCLWGDDIRPFVERPSLHRLIKESRHVLHGLLARPDDWWNSLPLDDMAALLALPGRLLETAASGRVVSKVEALETLLTRRGGEIPAAAWPWCVWALGCRSIPVLRAVPATARPGGLVAARTLLAWAETQLGSDPPISRQT